jgi:hypothetical protein
LEIESVANDPTSAPQPGRGGRTLAKGTRDGVEIEVMIEKDGTTIVTAYPINLPRNPGPPRR